LFDEGFLLSVLVGNPAVAVAALAIFNMVYGLDDHQKLFGVFAGALVYAAGFKNLKWKRVPPTFEIVFYAAIPHAFGVVTAKYIPVPAPFVTLPFEYLIYRDNDDVWAVKACATLFLWACVYFIPQIPERNIFVLGAFVIGYAIMQYGALKQAKTKHDPSTDSRKNN
jgi:hypothetical protein